MKNNPLRASLTTIILCFLLCFSAPAFAGKILLEKAMPEGGKAELTFEVEHLLTMTETPFTVDLIGGTGKVFTDAAVSLRLIMPAMAMPPNNPKAHWIDGSYRGTCIFTMAGEWDAILIIQRPGHDMVDLNFNLGLVQMK